MTAGGPKLPIIDDQDPCKRCGSEHIERTAATAEAMVRGELTERWYVCRECGYQWPEEQ